MKLKIFFDTYNVLHIIFVIRFNRILLDRKRFKLPWKTYFYDQNLSRERYSRKMRATEGDRVQVNETAERMCDCSCSKSDPDRRPVRWRKLEDCVGSRRPNFVSRLDFLHATEVERAGKKTGHAVTGTVGFITSTDCAHA